MTERITAIKTAYDYRKGWGFLDKNGERVFFHIANSPDFQVRLGMTVTFEYAPPFRLGQKDQAINLHEVVEAKAETFATGVLDAQKESGGVGV